MNKKRTTFAGTSKTMLLDSCCKEEYSAVRGLGKFALPQDVPKEKTRQELEHNSNLYVPFLNDSNNLINQIFDVVQTSPTTRAILQQKQWMMMGDGFFTVPKRSILLQPATNQVSDADNALLDAYLSEINPERETVYDIWEKASADFAAFGNVFIEFTRTRVGGSFVFAQRHVPFAYGRIRKMEAGQYQPTHVGISQKWDTNSTMPDDLIEYPLYPQFEEINGAERSILHVKQNAVGLVYYGLPDWVSALIWGEMEYRTGKYNQSQFENGFSASAIIQFFAGGASEEEAEEILQRAKSALTGTGNNSKILMQVLSDEAARANVQKLSDDSEGRFLELTQLSREMIVTAHRWTMSLAGMGIGGQLGSNQQIRSEYEIVYNAVIKPMQNTLLYKWLNLSIQEAAKWGVQVPTGVDLKVKAGTPVSFLGDITPSEVLTVNEQREVLGYEQIEETTEVQNGNTN